MTQGHEKKRRPNPHEPSSNSPHNRALLPLLAVCLVMVVGLCTATYLWRPVTSETTEMVSEPGSRAATAAGNSARGSTVVRLTTPHATMRSRAVQAGLDPRDANWPSEVFAEQAGTKLKRLAARLKRVDASDTGRLVELVTHDFRCGPLRPATLAPIFTGPAITVRRSPQNAAEAPATPSLRRGAVGLAAAIKELATPLANASNIDVQIKIIDVQQVPDEDDVIQTTSYFESSGATPAGVIAQRATWICRWKSEGSESLRLAELRAHDYQETETAAPWFSDCTQRALGHNQSFRDQLRYGIHQWLGRVESVHDMQMFARCGLAVGDVNGDGLEDIYVCQPGGLPNRLYVQKPNGQATDRSSTAGVDWLDKSTSALLLDLDNDGDQDLIVATVSGILAMENDSTGRFERRAVLPPTRADVQSLSAADFDQDGDLDLYICVDSESRSPDDASLEVGFLYHDANDGGANLLLRNDIATAKNGEWRFTDATVETGLDAQNRRHSLAAAWEDYDNDGDSDLYVANDYGQNCLYRNDDGRFVNVAEEAGVVDFGSGMSVSWADYNRDGLVDLYVGNMFSSAGSRITRQAQFKANEDEQVRSLYRRFAKGNSLFANSAGGNFRDVGAEAAVEMGRWAWSSVFADLNNDGWDDLLVANGYLTTEDTGDL